MNIKDKLAKAWACRYYVNYFTYCQAMEYEASSDKAWNEWVECVRYSELYSALTFDEIVELLD